jgi:hypothetical protein
MRTRDSTNHLGDAPKEENDAAALPPPEPKSGSRVSSGGRGGEERAAHEDASKEVTVLAGVAVVRFTQGFHPALPSTPTPADMLQGVIFGLTTDE